MSFSRRTSRDERPNALTEALARRRASPSQAELLDLTVSNPTTAGIAYPPDVVTSLADPKALVYAPDPLGLPSAREVVAGDYRTQGLALDASRIALTSSTSEAYAVLFKTLCDPGDEILVPAPSYPLLDMLADFEAVTLVRYPLVYAQGWHVDVAALARARTERTRAIVVVAPNNPTGSYLGAGELEAMLDLGLPIVSDEVFARYPLGDGVPEGRVDSVLRAERGLVFALSGLSKLAALPQMKLGWIAVGGDDARAEEAMKRLELVLDAYLSVAAPVQHALPSILSSAALARASIAARTRQNLQTARKLVAGTHADVLVAEGGWYAVLRVPETEPDERWALRLVEEDGVHVQPGYFFDMDRGAHLVVSLLTPEATFEEGMKRIARRVS